MSPFATIGVLGFFVYLVPYGLLQLDRIDGNSRWYTVLNMVAATMVLLSMIDQFNLASALTQSTWILIGVVGLCVRGNRSVRDSLAAPAAPTLMQTDWLEHERFLLNRVRRGEIDSAELSAVLDDLVVPAQQNSVEHVRLLVTLLDAAPTLRSTISAVVINAYDADDALQETLLAVSNSLPAYRGEAPVLAWATGIARNKAKDLLRRKGRPIAPDPRETLPTEHERFTSQWATHADVDQALQTLSPKLRTVFELADIEGLTYVEVAERLGIERNTVASRLRRARAQLQLIVAVGAPG